jgi:preprotein translocase subunit SecE
MERIKNIWKTTYDELMNKVTWPTWDELIQSTLVVLLASLIFAAVIYVIDQVFDVVTTLLYSVFG